MKNIYTVFCSLFLVFNIQSQDVPNKYAANVSSIDSIVSSIYEIVSGEKGEERNWELHQTIFHPEAQIISNYVDKNGEYQIYFLTVDEYMDQYRDYFKENYLFEQDVNREIEKFGNMAHVFSTFESYEKPGDSIPYKKGTASIQLYNDGKRWYVLNMYYKNESKNEKVPEKYFSSN